MLRRPAIASLAFLNVMGPPLQSPRTLIAHTVFAMHLAIRLLTTTNFTMITQTRSRLTTFPKPTSQELAVPKTRA